MFLCIVKISCIVLILKVECWQLCHFIELEYIIRYYVHIFYYNVFLVYNKITFISEINCQVVSNSISSDFDALPASSNKTIEDVRPTGKISRESRENRIKPLAAGGIGLLSGLIIISATIGIFILVTKRKNNDFIYEAAPKGDVIQHI